jgi:hypothetical protein
MNSPLNSITMRVLTAIEWILLAFLAVILGAVVTASAVEAAPLDTWSGAGPNACDGRCSLEWAMTKLTDDERAQLEAVMASQAEPEKVMVMDGAMFSLATYFKGGTPRAYRTSTVAVLPDGYTPAQGWSMGEWSFVKLDACDNWTIVTDQTIDTTGLPAENTEPSELYRVKPKGDGTPRVNTGTPGETWTFDPEWPTFDTPTVVVIVTPDPGVITSDVGVVPLPAPFFMLVAGMGALALVRRRA